MEVLEEISKMLNTGLDKKALSILLSLCQLGVNPTALAKIDRVEIFVFVFTPVITHPPQKPIRLVCLKL